MEQTFIYPAIHPTDCDYNEKKNLLECKGLVIDIDNHSIEKERRIERKELIIDIPPELEASRCPDKYCIYRVPKRLREVNNMAYTPRLVSIGPFHHRSEELKDMDIQKFLILKNFCNRIGKSIDELKGVIRPKEMEIRSCYLETFLLSSEGFLNMILLDAIFILELFRRKSEKDSGSSKPHDHIYYILSRRCMEFSIGHDLLLLENQLPFFVLEDLYQHVEPKTEKTLLELSLEFFGDLYYDWKPESQKGWPEYVKVKHFTDLVRYFFIPKKNEGPNSKKCGNVMQCLPDCFKPKCCSHKNKSKHLHCTATKLDEAGLKFTTPDQDTCNLLDIKLRDNYCLETFPCFNLSWLLSCLPFLKSDCLERRVQRCLEVPPLCVDDTTEALFRNLMALEQCHYPDETYICDYIVLLDDLITTEADVMLLVEEKIIDNNLGSSAAVTKMFNNLNLEIALSQHSHYEELCKELNDYSDNIWNGLVGTLTRVYFTDFFKGTATVAGIIVLVLTLWTFISHRLGKD